MDLDETIIDNSRYFAELIAINQKYPYNWHKWTHQTDAPLRAGARGFLKFVASRGIDIFYITNRRESERTGTLNLLKYYELPFSNDEHLLMRSLTTNKEQCRQIILETHDIILLIGDSLNDFSDVFENKIAENRVNETDRLKNEFGRRFIILPNPVYGAWETCMYTNQDKKISDSEKYSVRKNVLFNHKHKYT